MKLSLIKSNQVFQGDFIGERTKLPKLVEINKINMMSILREVIG